ncbi:MAG: MerR family transcriptional regulator [Romboutsia sp.]|nr:MerR family transcriptional regulator [Romboutsia sp.]
MDKFTKYYSTGEFAKLCGVNKKTLFHYDNINLLKPEKILSNGYRYYSSNQLELFSVITALKELEMPLKEIKSFIDTRTPEKTLELFQKEKKLVEEKINNLKRIQKLLDVKLKLINEASSIPIDIILENQKEETLILSSKTKITDEPYDIETFVDHVKYCTQNNLSYGYPIGSIINKENLPQKFAPTKDDFIKYDYYFTKILNSKSSKNTTKKAQGTYAVIYHKGYYNTVYESYNKLLDFIHKNNYIIDSCAYEEVLIDEVVTNKFDDYVLKISIKITT